MSGVQRAQFQEAAVEHIVQRLSDRSGSRRILLADEVGLGKTIVARGVIEALAGRRRPRPLSVVYLCSNTEIADQNRTKLDPTCGPPIGRVTRLALESPDTSRDVLLYSFTPGTSLKEGTGLAWERRMLLYLIYRVFGEPVCTKRWREFFRCGSRDSWLTETTWSALCEDFERKTSITFQDELRREWTREGLNAAFLRGKISDFDADNRDSRTDRNCIVGRLRGVMQRVALRNIQADLVILDEVQRFREVLDQARKEGHIAAELFGRRVPVLILSATPYRALTLGHEVGDSAPPHHEDFFKMLEFLFDRDVQTPARISEDVKEFGQCLDASDLVKASNPDLLRLKREIEADLRKVICRTERNWYVLDQRKGVEESIATRCALPGREELEEYFRLHRALGSVVGGGSQVTEYWKSSPSLLTFLDAKYLLLRNLRDQRTKVPRALLTPAEEVSNLARRNHRIDRVITQALGDDGQAPLLWTAPTYMYYRDHFFGDNPPRKLLVFSGWRFVPKAVSVITSRVATDRYGGDPTDPTQPLKFSERGSFHVFDVCFPAPGLAQLADVRAIEDGVSRDAREAADVLKATIARLRDVLPTMGVKVTPSGGDSAWHVIARIEQRIGREEWDKNGSLLRQSLKRWTLAHGDDGPSAVVVQHRDQMSKWLEPDTSLLEISEARLRHISLVAAFSPANALWRALTSVFGRERTAVALPDLINLCLGPMRRYFNRPHVQQIIRRHAPLISWAPSRRGSDHGYAERVMLYAADAHLQAVLDEYSYLQRHAGQADTVEKAIKQFQSIWTLARGNPRTNIAGGHGAMVRIKPDAESHATHFALAFGDDVSQDTGLDEDGERMRKSVVREAFNSPFWPFVLATTSVGQEGLDFHLYCRDILHWNLPSNPVDLEQREGRINRRDCLAIRASIAQDWPLSNRIVVSALNKVPQSNVWQVIFEQVENYEDLQRYKHGLYPHWVYECRDPQATVRIQRHVPFFSTSREAVKYEQLKIDLALYRLVFGQANQEDLLTRQREQIRALPAAERERVLRRIGGYMLNLSPVGHEQALKYARDEADKLLDGESPSLSIKVLLRDIARLRVDHMADLSDVAEELDALVQLVEESMEKDAKFTRASVISALSALAYLRNPYDRIFDLHVEDGFVDDLEVIRDAHRGLAGCDASL